jgi:hypothetical protein
MANEYGMVDLMTRTYRNYNAAVAAGQRRAKSTGNPCYVGMLLNCKFYLADESPERDWRWESYTLCTPNASRLIVGGGGR